MPEYQLDQLMGALFSIVAALNKDIPLLAGIFYALSGIWAISAFIHHIS